jgi:hypothetical protein
MSLLSRLLGLFLPTCRIVWRVDAPILEAERRLKRATDPRPQYRLFDQDVGLFRGSIHEGRFNLGLKRQNYGRNFFPPRLSGRFEALDEATRVIIFIKPNNANIGICVFSALSMFLFFGGWRFVVEGNVSGLWVGVIAFLITLLLTSTWHYTHFHGKAEEMQVALRTALSGDESGFYPFSG